MGAHPLYHLQMAAAVDGATLRPGPRDLRHTQRQLRAHQAGLSPVHHQRQAGADSRRRAGRRTCSCAMTPSAWRPSSATCATSGSMPSAARASWRTRRFYDLADRDGIMILPGWECCDKWESAARTGGEPWDAADEKVAAASMASEARLLRNHPSVIGFLIGSDNAPPPALAKCTSTPCMPRTGRCQSSQRHRTRGRQRPVPPA